MPPIAKITKEMILQTCLEITRKTGFDTVNARSIAGELRCSTRPIFTCYENMGVLKKAFLKFAYAYYEQYVSNYRTCVEKSPELLFPLSYISFAGEEPNVFKLLFVSDMELDMAQAKDFYREGDNVKRARQFAELIGIEAERAKMIFLDLFLYSHGIAVLTATKKITFDKSSAKKMIEDLLAALLKQEKTKWRSI